MSLFDYTILGDNFNLKMSFDTSYRVNYNLAQFLFLLSREFTYHRHVGVA